MATRSTHSEDAATEFYHTDLDIDRSDVDSTLGDSNTSIMSQSLESSMYDYIFENGRTYHAYKEGAYPYPNDETEQKRLRLHHLLFRKMLQERLYTAPIAEDPQCILDIGTGTGQWAIDVADERPSARVIGTDLSPIQPNWVPPNCNFYIDDAADPWLFGDNFDLVHARALCGSISDWPSFLREAHRSLKPGGWVELQEPRCEIRTKGNTISQPHLTAEWIKNLNSGSELFGKSLNVAQNHCGWLQETGFVEVREEIIEIPIGPWQSDETMKEMGTIELEQMLLGVEAFTLALFTRVLKLSFEKTNSFIEGVKRELLDQQHQWYTTYHFVIGRKPVRCIPELENIGVSSWA